MENHGSKPHSCHLKTGHWNSSYSERHFAIEDQAWAQELDEGRVKQRGSRIIHDLIFGVAVGR